MTTQGASAHEQTDKAGSRQPKQSAVKDAEGTDLEGVVVQAEVVRRMERTPLEEEHR